MTKYHISPKTGKPNVCKAKNECPVTGEHGGKHFESKEEAIVGAEHRAKAENTTLDEFESKFRKILGEENPHFEGTLNYCFKNFREAEEELAQTKKTQSKFSLNDREDVLTIEELAREAKKENPDEEKMRKLLENLYCTRNQVADHRRTLAHLAFKTYSYGTWKNYESPVVEERDKNGLWVYENGASAGYQTVVDENVHYGSMNFGSEQYVEKALDRIARGENFERRLGVEPRVEDGVKVELEQYDTIETEDEFLPDEEHVFARMSRDGQGYLYDQKFYLATAFPNFELQEALNKYEISNVKVDSFTNGREYGNVYTVETPDGDTMSFSVYEHRNTDSIIINGKKNWDGVELPYAQDSKHAYFSEIRVGDTRRAAENLAFFIKEVQNGEIDDTDELVAKAEKLDWTSIIDKKIPGYKNWVINTFGDQLDPNDPRRES